MALASPAHIGSTHWFLFVAVTSFIATLLWTFVYLLGIREVLNLAVNWILTEFLNYGIAALLYFIAFIVQLVGWSAIGASVPFRGANIAAGVRRMTANIASNNIYSLQQHLYFFMIRTGLWTVQHAGLRGVHVSAVPGAPDNIAALSATPSLLVATRAAGTKKRTPEHMAHHSRGDNMVHGLRGMCATVLRIDVCLSFYRTVCNVNKLIQILHTHTQYVSLIKFDRNNVWMMDHLSVYNETNLRPLFLLFSKFEKRR